MNILKILTASLLTLYFGVAIGSSESEKTTIGDAVMAVTSTSPAFEAVKKKLGKWEGQMTQSLNGHVFDVSYEWRLTAGGNTITTLSQLSLRDHSLAAQAHLANIRQKQLQTDEGANRDRWYHMG